MGIEETSQYVRFVNALQCWLSNAKPKFLNQREENIEINKCIHDLETYTVTITLSNGKDVDICAMTRKGYFVLSGKKYVWPWRETYCPNYIYKLKDGVEVWSRPIQRPWELYQGRLKMVIHCDTICIEGYYMKGKRSLLRCIHDHNMSDLTSILMNLNPLFDTCMYVQLLKGKWEDKKDSLKNHPFLPHLVTKASKEVFLSCMVLQLLDTSVSCTNTNDISTKRIIGVEWLIGHICTRIENNAYSYMMKRIHSQGQLIHSSSYFETISHVTRVIRGSTSYGNLERRELDVSHRGVYCMYRSSEGESIGLKVDLVDDVTIQDYNIRDLKVQNIENTVVNGYIPSTYSKVSYMSQDWTWTDGGRVIPGKVDSVGYVAKQLIFPRHMPPVRSMYATTHIRQAVRLVYPQSQQSHQKIRIHQ